MKPFITTGKRPGSSSRPRGAMVLGLVLATLAWSSIGQAAVTIGARLVSGNFDGLDPRDPIWSTATQHRVALDTTITATGVPQLLPSSKFRYLKVKAIHNNTDIYFRFEWRDGTRDESVVDTPLFADALALQIPYSANSSIAMGNQMQPVNMLFWRADLGDPATGLGRPQNIVAGGAGTVQTTPDSETLPTAFSQTWTNRNWTVVIRRPLSGTSSANGNLVNLIPGTNYRITFGQWDGRNQERNGVKLVSGSWQTLSIKTK